MSHEVDSVFGEHREVCAFLMHMLLEADSTQDDPFVWADLGCGRGRVLRALRYAMPEHLREYLCYRGYDRSIGDELKTNVREASLHCQSRPIILDLGRPHLPDSPDVTLVTLTNVIHEIPPISVPAVLLLGLRMLRPDGYLLAYDMERLPEKYFREEGDAIPWSREELADIVQATLAPLKPSERYAVARWTHSSTTGWTLAMPRSVLGAIDDDRAELCRQAGEEAVLRLIDAKLDDADAAWRSIDEYLTQVQPQGDLWSLTLAEAAAELPFTCQARYSLRRAKRDQRGSQ